MAKQLELFDISKQPDYLILSEVFPEAESEEIEYKSAAGGFPNEFWKTYSAFANSGANVKLQYYFDLHRSDITKLLQDLCKNGYLISENKGRWTTYRLNTAFKPDEDTSNVDTSNVDTSNVDTSNVDSLYQPKTPIQEQITDVCQIDYISIEEIASKVGRSVKYLKNNIIPEMVKKGFLVKLYSQPNHPQQKYISKR